MTGLPRSSEILAACADLAEVVFGDGDVILAEGDPGGALYVLVEGEVAIHKGDVFLLTVSEPGAFFGEMAALLGGPFSATVTAVGTVRVRMTEDGPALLADRPEITLHAARVLARRLHAATAYLADIKHQFGDRTDHLGMMDSILGALMQNQGTAIDTALSAGDDPRL